MINSFSVFIVLITLMSCNNLNKKEYKKWFNSEENGFYKTKTINNISFNAKLRPPELLAFYELGLEQNEYPKTTIDSTIQKYKNGYNFVFEITTANENLNISNLLPKEKLDLLLNSSTVFYLISEKDTLNPDLIHIERDFEIGKKICYTVVFPKLKNCNNLELIYIDNIFNKGIIKFNFEYTPSKIPSIPIN